MAVAVVVDDDAPPDAEAPAWNHVVTPRLDDGPPPPPPPEADAVALAPPCDGVGEMSSTVER